ncbi:ATP-binding protein, partial [Streptomyces sp. Act-28]
MGPHPAVAAIRLAVRRVLHDVLNEVSRNTAACPAAAAPAHPGAVDPERAARADEPPLVLVACSGGADSMALASALAFEARKLAVRAGGITIDHGLQPGSDLRAAEVASRLGALRLDPVEAIAVTVGR